MTSPAGRGLGPLGPIRLLRRLKLVHIFALATGAMISSGIFILPGPAFARTGPAVIISYLIAGLLAAMGMLALAELATAMPKAGGDYYFAMRGLGPAVGTIAGLLSWFSLSLKSAFALAGMSAFGVAMLGLDPQLVGLGFCLLFLLLNLGGVRSAASVQLWLVGALFLLVGGYIVFGLPEIRLMNFQGLDSNAPGAGAVFATAGFVFVAYGGLLKISSVAEEVERPEHNIPYGLVLSMLAVGIAYVLAVVVTVGLVPAEKLAGSLEPLSDGAEVIFGRWGWWALAVAAMLAFVSTANAGMMAASRYLFALSRDGLLPGVLSRINPRFHTPHVALVVTAGLMAVAVFIKLELLVQAASTVLILTYLLALLLVIVMRESRVQNYRPRFRSPFYPWMHIAGLFGFGLLLFQLGPLTLLLGAGLIVAGFAVYWFYGRHRTSREFALLHLIERLTARELVTGSLEAELHDVIREREHLVRDWFDHLVEDCVVLDLNEPHDIHSLTERIAEALAPKVCVEPGVIYERLVEREVESSSALSPTLAVPHVIFDGTGRFELALVRCRPGVRFSAAAPEVEAVFAIVGTRDRRNFHLRTLAAIAQIVRSPDFEQRWRSARGENGLRNVILLGKRRRQPDI
ncbi:MAG: amino acid permease [bacterium]